MDCKNCNFKSKAFQKLTEEQMFKVDEHRVELSFKKGELLSKQGMLLTQIIYIKKGFAKLYVEQDGELVILGIAQPGTFVDLSGLTDAQWQAACEAIQESTQRDKANGS